MTIKEAYELGLLKVGTRISTNGSLNGTTDGSALELLKKYYTVVFLL